MKEKYFTESMYIYINDHEFCMEELSE